MRYTNTVNRCKEEEEKCYGYSSFFLPHRERVKKIDEIQGVFIVFFYSRKKQKNEEMK